MFERFAREAPVSAELLETFEQQQRDADVAAGTGSTAERDGLA